MRVIPSDADVGSLDAEGFPKRGASWLVEAIRFRARDGTVYLRDASGKWGESDRDVNGQ